MQDRRARGLAKLTEPIEGDEFASTATADAGGKPITEEGAIVGTVAYMSPEQAEGKTVDGRSDIFSFGSVLYEMITGRRAFQGDNKISTLSAILNKEPAPLSADVPREFERIITRCLRKDPAGLVSWSPDGALLYGELNRDGFRCIWAQHLDPATKHPVGSPFAVFHSHNARLSLANQEAFSAPVMSRDKMFFSMGERTGNIWMAEIK